MIMKAFSIAFGPAARPKVANQMADSEVVCV